MPNLITAPLVGPKARKKILAGVNAVVTAISPTLGPKGRSALLPRSYNRGPRIADDGYFVAENVNPRDEHERLAADAFKEAIRKTNERAGDGTTSTGVIAGKLINETFEKLSDQDIPAAGAPPKSADVIAIQQEMKTTKDLVVEEIKKRAKPIKTLADLERIALIAVKEEIPAKLVAKMAWDVGRDSSGTFIDNHIDVIEGYKGEIETEVITGMKFPSKVAHRAFVTKPERHEMVADQVPVLITNHKLDNPYVVVAILDKLKVSKIAIFAPEFGTGVLTSLIKTTQNGLFCFPIKSPALRTVQLEDLAAYTGAKVIDKDVGMKLENITIRDLGYAERIVVKDTENREDAILLGGKGEKLAGKQKTMIEDRREMLKEQLGEARNDLDKKQLNLRIANLSSAVGIIRVGSSTDNENLQLKLKIEDGVFACKAALQEGYVQGGGLCLKDIAEKLPESVLTSALKAPYELIQKNAGGKLDIGKEVIDPAKVVRLEVEHAVSVASTMITTEIVIPEIREKGPAEGYEDIAKAIRFFAVLFGKQHSLIKDAEDFHIEDMMRRSEELATNDNG